MADIQSPTSSSDAKINPSPITVLSDDILTLIFEINTRIIPRSPTGVSPENPLIVTQAESQVCRSWRALLLDSPIIWGRCIYLEVLGCGKREWWKEVLRRTQSAPLWILGQVTSTGNPSNNVKIWFIHLLKSWKRIQKLDVAIYSTGREICESMKIAFCSPAPILSEFHVKLLSYWSDRYMLLLPESPQLLFQNHAPSLVEMKCERVMFRTDSPWLANLRVLRMSVHVGAAGILDLLSLTPLLETLYLSPPRNKTAENPISTNKWLGSQISLPRLASIHIKNTVATCMSILDNIYPAANCSLKFTASDNQSIPAHLDAAPKDFLSRYISNFFSTHTSTVIHIDHHSDRLTIKNKSLNWSTSPGDTFSCDFRTVGPDSIATIAMSVFQAFAASYTLSPSLFNTVTVLELDISCISTSVILALYSMLLAFKSVEILISGCIQYVSLESLRDYGVHAHQELFPKLRTVRNCVFSSETLGPPNVLISFLEGRKKVGLPVARLDLRFCLPCNSLNDDFGSLESVHGLEVVWMSGDSTVCYVCGSGDPEKLRFNINSPLVYF